MTFEPRLVDTIRDLSAAAYKTSTECRKALKEAEERERIWKRLLDHISNDWPLHVLDLMHRQQQILRQMREESHPAVGDLESVYKDAKAEAAQVKKRFPSRLEDACRSAGLEIDHDSRHPRYYFRDKFFTLEINDQKQQARLSDHESRLKDLPADVGAVVQVLSREVDRIFKRRPPGMTFIRKIRRHYLAILKKEGLEDGAAVPVRDITRRLSKSEKKFRADEFVVDLSRLVEKGPLEIDGHRLDLQQTKDTSQGILLHGNASRGYVGFIVFREVKK